MQNMEYSPRDGGIVTVGEQHDPAEGGQPAQRTGAPAKARRLQAAPQAAGEFHPYRFVPAKCSVLFGDGALADLAEELARQKGCHPVMAVPGMLAMASAAASWRIRAAPSLAMDFTVPLIIWPITVAPPGAGKSQVNGSFRLAKALVQHVVGLVQQQQGVPEAQRMQLAVAGKTIEAILQQINSAVDSVAHADPDEVTTLTEVLDAYKRPGSTLDRAVLCSLFEGEPVATGTVGNSNRRAAAHPHFVISGAAPLAKAQQLLTKDNVGSGLAARWTLFSTPACIVKAADVAVDEARQLQLMPAAARAAVPAWQAVKRRMDQQAVEEAARAALSQAELPARKQRRSTNDGIAQEEGEAEEDHGAAEEEGSATAADKEAAGALVSDVLAQLGKRGREFSAFEAVEGAAMLSSLTPVAGWLASVQLSLLLACRNWTQRGALPVQATLVLDADAFLIWEVFFNDSKLLLNALPHKGHDLLKALASKAPGMVVRYAALAHLLGFAAANPCALMGLSDEAGGVLDGQQLQEQLVRAQQEAPKVPSLIGKSALRVGINLATWGLCNALAMVEDKEALASLELARPILPPWLAELLDVPRERRSGAAVSGGGGGQGRRQTVRPDGAAGGGAPAPAAQQAGGENYFRPLLAAMARFKVAAGSTVNTAMAKLIKVPGSPFAGLAKTGTPFAMADNTHWPDCATLNALNCNKNALKNGDIKPAALNKLLLGIAQGHSKDVLAAHLPAEHLERERWLRDIEELLKDNVVLVSPAKVGTFDCYVKWRPEAGPQQMADLEKFDSKLSATYGLTLGEFDKQQGELLAQSIWAEGQQQPMLDEGVIAGALLALHAPAQGGGAAPHVAAALPHPLPVPAAPAADAAADQAHGATTDTAQ